MAAGMTTGESNAELMDLTGRNALVTGGGTGIGYGCAEALLAAGARVTIAGRRLEVLEDAAARLRADAGGRPAGQGGGPGPGGAGGMSEAQVDVVACDITDEAQVAHAVEVAAGGANLDVLVANAGSGYPGAILQMGADAWNFCLSLNVTGTALCLKHAALVMAEHGGGSVVAISSTSGTKVQPWLAAYDVSKAGLDMLVRCASVELSRLGVRVNSIQPGYVTTETMQVATSPELHDTLERAAPLGRAGTAADIGRMVAFLASDAAGWVTGQAFGVDGGLNVPVMPSMASIAAHLYGQDVVDQYALPDLTALNLCAHEDEGSS